MKHFPESEFIINQDGSVFHLHLLPEQLADKIILVGDPGRVNLVDSFFDSRDFEVSSRDGHTIGGTYKGKRLMCISHGIGTCLLYTSCERRESIFSRLIRKMDSPCIICMNVALSICIIPVLSTA